MRTLTVQTNCLVCQKPASILFAGQCSDCELKEYLELAAELLTPDTRRIEVTTVISKDTRLCPTCDNPWAGSGVCNECSEGGKYPFGF